jgi:predicted RND superfamily exporter protein
MNLVLAIRAALPALVSFCARRRILVIVLGILLVQLSMAATFRLLGVTTDTSKMFSDSLPWKQSSQALGNAFPQNDGLLVAVVDAKIPEEAEATAAAARTTICFPMWTSPMPPITCSAMPSC